MTVSLMLIFLLPERTAYRSTSENEKCSESISLVKAPRRRIPLKLVWLTLTNVRKWPHFLATACVFSTWSPLITYTPSIIMSLGYSRVQANALAAIGTFMTLPVILLFAWLSDKTNKRGLLVMIAIAAYLIALIALKVIQPHVGKWSTPSTMHGFK